jgi:hypothetical protein
MTRNLFFKFILILARTLIDTLDKKKLLYPIIRRLLQMKYIDRMAHSILLTQYDTMCYKVSLNRVASMACTVLIMQLQKEGFTLLNPQNNIRRRSTPHYSNANIFHPLNIGVNTPEFKKKVELLLLCNLALNILEMRTIEAARKIVSDGVVVGPLINSDIYVGDRIFEYDVEPVREHIRDDINQMTDYTSIPNVNSVMYTFHPNILAEYSSYKNVDKDYIVLVKLLKDVTSSSYITKPELDTLLLALHKIIDNYI